VGPEPNGYAGLEKPQGGIDHATTRGIPPAGPDWSGNSRWRGSDQADACGPWLPAVPRVSVFSIPPVPAE
jgi:hypothetical protein